MGLNKVFLMARLCHSPDVKFMPTGTAVCTLRLAANRSWNDKASGQKKEEHLFVDAAFFGTQAESAGRYLTKGQEVLIEGELRMDEWVGKKDGQKHTGLSIRGHSWQFVGGKPEGRRVDKEDASEGGNDFRLQEPAKGMDERFQEGEDIPF